jgi:hypothetical protein
MSMLNTMRGAIEKRLAYVRTRNAIQNMPLDIALDLDIYQGDADLIARRAVYGL